MKYVHGTDDKNRDLLMVWGNRVIVIIVSFAFLFFLWFGFVVAGWAFTGSAEGILFLISIFLCLVAGLFDLYEGVWYSAKYVLDEAGITIVYLFHSKHYPWNAFQKVFLSKIRRGVRVVTAYDYIILMISECGALTRSLSIPDCWKYQSKFIVIRNTEERIREFSKYCTISDPPDIKAYKYF